MKKHFVINDPVYNHDILITYESDEQAIKTIMRRTRSAEAEVKHFIDSKSSYAGRTTQLESGHVVIHFRFDHELVVKDVPNLCELISHECFHAAEFVLNGAGVYVSNRRPDEAHAYYLGFLVREVHKKIDINKYIKSHGKKTRKR